MSSFQITALKIKHNPFAKAFLDAKERYLNLKIIPQMIKEVRSAASNVVFHCRSDHKDVPDHSADSQQSGYSQREFHLFQHL